MKKITALFLLVASFMMLGQGIKFEETNFKTLLAKAKKENKLIFMDAYASWCGPCKLMAKNVFPLQTVGDYYNANFINSKIDMEKGEGVAIAKKYGVKAYPTYLFINGDGEVIHRVSGYFEEKDFLAIGKDANDPSKQMGALKKQFEAGEKDPEFLKNFMKIFAFSDSELATKAALRYFDGKKSQSLSNDDLSYLFALTPDSNSPLYKVITDNKTEILKSVPEASYNKILQRYQLNSIMKLAYNKENKTFNEPLFLSEAGKIMPQEDAKLLLSKTKMSLAWSEKNYPNYQKYALAYYGNGESDKFSSDELNSVAWNFFEKIEDKTAMKSALAWAQQSVKKAESYANADTLANVYFKLGDKKNAKLWAEKSIELAKKSGEDSSSTQQLLDKVK